MTGGSPSTVPADAGLRWQGEGVAVVVSERPFGLRLLDGDGAEVLATVAPDPRGRRRRWPLPDTVPGTGIPLPERAPLYAPVTFLVGFERIAQFRAGWWVADLFAAVRGGTEYALDAVLRAEQDGDVLRLEVTTTDPTGRRAEVVVAPDEGRTARIAVTFDRPEGVASVAASFRARADEAFHGFGGRRNATDQRGERFTCWLEEFMQRPDAFRWVRRVPGIGATWQYPTGAQGAYYVQPLFVSSAGYGFWLDRDERSRFRMASDREDAWQVQVAAPALDVVVAPGPAPQAITALTAITGRHPLPPRWSLGPMVSRAVQVMTGTPQRYVATVLADLDAIEEHDLDLTGYAFEGWSMLDDAGRFDEVVARLRRRGIKPVTYYKAFVGGSAGLEPEALYQEAIANRHVALDRRGRPFRFGSPLDITKPAVLIDFTDAAAVAWWQARIRAGLDAGVEGFMQDFGEHTFAGMRFADGSTGAQLHNRYPVLYHRATREVFEAYTAEHPDREPWFFVRSGYTGRPGSAAYEGASWGGDNTADWSRASGIASVIPDMLNRGLGGAYGYATDIGGYVDTFAAVDAELFVRWAQLAALIPVNRVHGSPVRGTPMPWSFGEATLERYREAVALHRRAQPLILRLWAEAVATGLPICRPLWLHHPDDRRARAEQQQWLLGPDVLAAPVVERAARSRLVYFPEGTWVHPETGARVDGPIERRIDAPLDRLPYFVREGTDPFAG